MRRLFAFALLALGPLAAGCASDRFDRREAEADPGLLLLDAVKPVHQADEVYCGPACLVMVLKALGRDTTQHEIAERARTKGRGTEVEELAKAARLYGFEAAYFKGEPDGTANVGLLYQLERGRPVIVGLLKREPFPSRDVTTHFEVVVGRWPKEKRWVLADPATKSLHAPRDEAFLAEWEALHRVAIVVMPKARGPGAKAPDPPRNPPAP